VEHSPPSRRRAEPDINGSTRKSRDAGWLGLVSALLFVTVMTPITSSPSTAIDDVVLLEGPHSRRRELALVLRTVRDFIAGFRVLHFVGPCVTVFGSARFREGIRTTTSRARSDVRSVCSGSRC